MTASSKLTHARGQLTQAKNALANAEEFLGRARARRAAAIEKGDSREALGADADIRAAETELEICRSVHERAFIAEQEASSIVWSEELSALERSGSWPALVEKLSPHLAELEAARVHALAAVGAILDSLREHNEGAARAAELAGLLGRKTAVRARTAEQVRALVLETSHKGPPGNLAPWVQHIPGHDDFEAELWRLFEVSGHCEPKRRTKILRELLETGEHSTPVHEPSPRAKTLGEREAEERARLRAAQKAEEADYQRRLAEQPPPGHARIFRA